MRRLSLPCGCQQHTEPDGDPFIAQACDKHRHEMAHADLLRRRAEEDAARATALALKLCNHAAHVAYGPSVCPVCTPSKPDWDDL